MPFTPNRGRVIPVFVARWTVPLAEGSVTFVTRVGSSGRRGRDCGIFIA